jgi:hypothetical protein
MRQFARPTPLERLSLEARIIYTAFAAFMILGYASSAWLYLDDDMDLGPERARVYYLGEPKAPVAPPPAADDDGPDLDLPEDGVEVPAVPQAPTAGGMRFEKPARQVMETFHFHLFSMSVCWVIIAHLFMMGGLSSRTKVALIALSGGVTAAHLLAPVLIRFGGPAWAPLMGPSGALLGVTWGFMTIHPVWEMWRLPLPNRRAADRAE